MLVATQKRNREKVIRKDRKQFVKILVLKLKRSCIKVIRKESKEFAKILMRSQREFT